MNSSTNEKGGVTWGWIALIVGIAVNIVSVAAVAVGGGRWVGRLDQIVEQHSQHIDQLRTADEKLAAKQDEVTSRLAEIREDIREIKTMLRERDYRK